MLSDIIDNDTAANNRPHSMSSTVFGLNALFTKPAQSIGPMIVFSILLHSGYAPQFVLDHVPRSRLDLTLRFSYKYRMSHQNSFSAGSHEPEMSTAAFRVNLFSTLCLVPFFLGLLQIVVWWRYTLRPDAKARTANLVEAH